MLAQFLTEDRLSPRKLAVRAGIPAVALLAVSLLSIPAAAAQSIDGTWVDSGGYTEITIRSCGNARCGSITKILKNKPGEPDHDIHNDNPALRDRPILGIQILSGLRRDGDEWKGKVYNPEDGNTYDVYVKPASGGRLSVKGCVAFFCRTRIWTPAR